MTFLPVAERELRVAARRRGTYGSRMVAAALALILFAGFVLLNWGGRLFRTNQLGPILFAIFSWLSFAFTSASGVFLTSDCLSEEKRDGTLGLLFLTDLRGYDVVFGKLLSNSLVAAYGLLAAFPVIGLALLLGGVTGAEFWRLMLVLCNTLFFSLAAGVLVSSLSRDPQKAMIGTVALCGVFIALFPAIDGALAGWNNAKFQARFSLASPGFTFSQAQFTRLGDFWSSLTIEHLVGWLFLTLACVWTPRSWQETAALSGVRAIHRSRATLAARVIQRAVLRRRLLAGNPVRWLVARDPRLG